MNGQSKARGAGLDDLTIDNLTPHVIRMSTGIDNIRINYLITKLIQYTHDYVREVQLQTEEWENVWQYLTRVGATCTPERQEFILLSDILGISALVDAINSNQTPEATETSILGPFHNDAAHLLENGQSITSNHGAGEPMLIRGKIMDTAANPVEHALVDIWETDGNGFYDMQNPEYAGPDCRGKFYTDRNGDFFLTGVRPVDYPIPSDGPVGDLLALLNRHCFRPAHVHFMVNHPSYEKLTTAVYSRESTYITSDSVFGAKTSLLVDFIWTEDPSLAKQYNIKAISKEIDGEMREGFWLLEHTFILAPRRSREGAETTQPAQA
ncbi:uncharacterized protein Z520_00898 [Fonsecaea multimorphosa CBS 102226]|uniref:Intradiol ring-cleavage dioxygenases domain-containing protein n=1 Tax=Fonsecaea multimorphosa CBS 102226 TaxID=1442371 RepID=A0A0D2KL36_9EURO|nr:uncharacterized protein Z520_00898 [Fonsecaea multimorphosa CBS 102226]KIY04205.1 hypothetical protein Z520_00898 [Fonsecaea multimorphosa CBS 102226]OAL32033.1 hypothetical protein AYO22_00903 [Fonsecaea multimorphosa]